MPPVTGLPTHTHTPQTTNKGLNSCAERRRWLQRSPAAWFHPSVLHQRQLGCWHGSTVQTRTATTRLDAAHSNAVKVVRIQPRQLPNAHSSGKKHTGMQLVWCSYFCCLQVTHSCRSTASSVCKEGLCLFVCFGCSCKQSLVRCVCIAFLRRIVGVKQPQRCPSQANPSTRQPMRRLG